MASEQFARSNSSFVSRMLRAARLESHLYEEVEADRSALPQAMLVVVLSSVAAGIGFGLASQMGDAAAGDATPLPVALTIGVVGALASWFAWALATFIIGTTILKGPETSSNLGELLRTIGFSTAPGILRIFVFLPGGLGGLVLLATSIWMLVAMVIAVRQALDFSTGRAIGTTAIGFFIQVIILVLVLSITGQATPA